jgi:tetratricopeptide (TPR) repeat protein
VIENTKLLLRIFARPVAAMSDVLDQGSLLFAVIAVIVISILGRIPLVPAGIASMFSFYTPLIVLAAAYVPGVLLLAWLIARPGGSFGSVFQRDYAPLLTCTAMAWSAANLGLVAAFWIVPSAIFPVVAGMAYIYFLVLMVFVVRTVFGSGNGTAVAVAGLSWIPLLALVFLWGPLRLLLGWLASPFVLFYAYYYLRNEFSNLGEGLRSRQHFRRMLEAAAVNPHDAEAQYQLGLIYQQRRQVTEAVRRFKAAVAIDPAETDAHFQLGRIALQQGRLEDALAEFQTVLDQNEKHNQSEILREIGLLYITAKRFDAARHELAEYVERRPYDPEGLYYYGLSLENLNDVTRAREVYLRTSEAARSAPSYLRRSVARWSRLAQRQLRKLATAHNNT